MIVNYFICYKQISNSKYMSFKPQTQLINIAKIMTDLMEILMNAIFY